MLCPSNVSNLIRDTLANLLQQAITALHELLLGLTRGDNNVITRAPASMTCQQRSVVARHDALLGAVTWGFAAAVAILGILVILGPNSPRGIAHRLSIRAPAIGWSPCQPRVGLERSSPCLRRPVGDRGSRDWAEAR